MFRKMMLLALLLLATIIQMAHAGPAFINSDNTDSVGNTITGMAGHLTGEWEYTENPEHATLPSRMFTLQVQLTGNTLTAQYCAIALYANDKN